MSYRIIVEPSAEREIRSALRWIIENQSRSRAGTWYHGLLKKVATLKTNPGRCPLAAENDKFDDEIRELAYGPRRNQHRIIFTIRDDAVHILYVHHSARDELEP